MIERDPALAAKTLRVANSSYYGLSNVGTVDRAISILGMNSIRSLVISVSYQQIISGRVTAKNFDKVAFWGHSLAVATASRILGKMLYAEKAEELYIAGMMHDVGYLVLDRFYSGELDQAICLAQDEQISVFEAEDKLFGFDHGVVGGMLAQKWGLPKPLEDSIKYHHRVIEDVDHQQMSAIVSVADYLAHTCGLNNNSPAGVTKPDPIATEMVGLPEQQLQVVAKVMMQEVSKAQAAFLIPVTA